MELKVAGVKAGRASGTKMLNQQIVFERA